MKGWSSFWNYESIKARAWSRKILKWGYWVWPQYYISKNFWSSGYPVESISHSSYRRDNLSNFKFRNERNGANTNLGRNFLFLNRTLSASKRKSHLLTKTHCPCNYLQSFYLAALIHKCRKKKQYPYAEHRHFTENRRTRSFQK